MFDFLKKKCYLADLIDDFCDVHCHLLWGVDDGCKDQRSADLLAEQMIGLGFTKLTLTPHIIYGLYDNQTESSLRARFAEMKPHEGIEYRLGAEYFLDENFMSHVNSDEPMLTIGDEWLLTEFALGATHVSHLESLFEASLGGKSIIIAHPERYSFAVERNYREINRLISRKFALQLNLLSLTGYHGPRVKRAAEEMLSRGLYTFVGSDAHSTAYTDAIRSGVINPNLAEPLKRLMANNREILWK